jgi:hypothetical protein
VVTVYHIEQKHLAIVVKVGMQRKTQQTMIAPSADFLTDINERFSTLDPRLIHGPYFPPSLPNKDPSIIGKSQTHRFIPGSPYRYFNKSRRQLRLPTSGPPHTSQPQQANNPNHQTSTDCIFSHNVSTPKNIKRIKGGKPPFYNCPKLPHPVNPFQIRHLPSAKTPQLNDTTIPNPCQENSTQDPLVFFTP